MRVLVLLIVALVACNNAGNSSTNHNTDPCPATAPDDGVACTTVEGSACTYAEASGLTDTCYCQQPFAGSDGTTAWSCNDCPWTDDSEPQACATVGQGCEYWSPDGELGCDCTCRDFGSGGSGSGSGSAFWDCIPQQTIGGCPPAPSD